MSAALNHARRLVGWFESNARRLPWRTVPRDPYLSLVAELMAQQTQLDRVVPRFNAFVRRFPTLRDLASATEDEIVEAWSGLGYYRRARLLHRLAVEVTAGRGELPETSSELEMLPGIGPYTAAAIASMVHGEAVPLIDGNVGRVGARVLALTDDPRKTKGKEAVFDWIRRLYRDRPAGVINEALMELGALVCTPAAPGCDGCPLADGCRAFITGSPEDYPPPRKTREPVDVSWIACIAVLGDGRWLLRVVDEGPILQGLWLPPFAESDPALSADRQALVLLPFEAEGPVEVLAPVKHSITHRRIEVTPARVRVSTQQDLDVGWVWADPTGPNRPTSSLLGKLHGSVQTDYGRRPSGGTRAGKRTE